MQLKVLTLNCWGIPVISKDRIPRMKAIAAQLAGNCYDIVCLQEVWTDSDYDLIKAKVQPVLPHSHYFYSGVIGSGICIFSKFPFQDVFFHQWPVNGYVHKLQHGDWFGGKGVGLCRLRIDGFTVNVYSAHLHAEYDRNCDEYMAHRVLQAFDTAQFIKLTSGGTDLVILAGDLNTEPGDLAYRLLTAATGLADAYLAAGDAVGDSFSTNEGCANSYTAGQLVQQKFLGKRIDYIMFRQAAGTSAALQHYEHPLPARVPHCTYSYSDHEAVCSTFAVARDVGRTSGSGTGTQAALKAVLVESIGIFDEAMGRLNQHKRAYWSITVCLFLMLLLTVGMDAPFCFVKVFHLARVLVTIVLCFTLVMATLWNNIEYNAVLAGKSTMEVNLKQLLAVEASKQD